MPPSRTPRASARLLVSAAVLAVAAAAPAAAAPPPAGGLVQLAPPQACFSTVAAGGCTALGASGAIYSPNGLAITPDGRGLYATGGNGGSAAFDRGPDGTLTAVSAGLNGNVVASAPEGSALAVGERQTGQYLGKVQIYPRDPATGALSFGAQIADSCGSTACATDNGLNDVQGVAYSPDGKTLYAAASQGGGNEEGAVTAFARNGTTEAISLIGCTPRVKTTAGVCQLTPAANGVGGAQGVIVSPDSRFVYVAGGDDNAVVGFSRVSSGVGLGRLAAPVNCLRSGPATTGCTTAPGLGGAHGLAISPDGRDLYVAGQFAGLAVLRRDLVSGVLSPTECFEEDGGGGCTADPGIPPNTNARSVAVSPDGRVVHLAGGNGATGFVRSYARDAASGRLTPLSCVSHLAAPGCATAAGLHNAANVVVAPDGRQVYATGGQGGDGQGAIAAFRVEAAPSCAGTDVATGPGAPVLLPLACTDADGEPLTRTITTPPTHGTLGPIDDGAAVVRYTPAPGFAGGDAVGFAASDGTNASGPASVGIGVGAPAPGGPAGPGPGGPPPPPRTERVSLRAAVAARQRTRAVGRNGLRVRATCRPGCSLRLALTASRAEARRLRLGRRTVTVGTARATLRAGRPTTVAVRLTAPARKALRRARRARLSLRVVATAPDRTTVAKRLAVPLRR